MHTVFLCTPFVKLPLYVCSAESPPSIRYMHHTFAPILCYFTWLLLLVLCLLSLAIILAFQRHWLWCAEIARRADQCVSGRSKAAPLPRA